MSRLLSFSQSGIRRPQRANAVFKAEVPAEFVTALAEPIFVHVDVEYPIPDTLYQLPNTAPVAKLPCPSCGRDKGHWAWCPTLPLVNVLAVHVQEHATEKHTWVGAEISP